MSRTDSSAISKTPKKAHRVPPYRRPLVVGIFLVGLAAVIVVTILICKNLNDKATNHDTNTPGMSEVKPPEPVEPKPDDDVENKTPQYEGEDPNELEELTGVITYQDVDPETLVLHSAVSINQYLHSDGQCVFNLERDGTIIRTASAVAEPDVTTSICGPFSLSIDGLSGTYQIKVVITGDGKRGTILGEITI